MGLPEFGRTLNSVNPKREFCRKIGSVPVRLSWGRNYLLWKNQREQKRHHAGALFLRRIRGTDQLACVCEALGFLLF